MSQEMYVLDDNNNPVPAKDKAEWYRFMEGNMEATERRRVGLAFIGPDKVRVSTVFLGLDHRFGEPGPPVLFESMVFTDGWTEDYMARYETWDQARSGHKAIVYAVQSLVSRGVVINHDTMTEELSK